MFLLISGLIFHLLPVLRRRPPPAALATALALQLVQALGPRPAWTLCTPRDTPNTLTPDCVSRSRTSCLTRATARNMEFFRPTSAEKCGGNVSLATVMAVAANKPGKGHGLGHGG